MAEELLSNNVAGSEAQWTAINLAWTADLAAWIVCARSSLPVPLSPRNSSVARLGATRWIN
jgi:hypothetical protein